MYTWSIDSFHLNIFTRPSGSGSGWFPSVIPGFWRMSDWKSKLISFCLCVFTMLTTLGRHGLHLHYKFYNSTTETFTQVCGSYAFACSMSYNNSLNDFKMAAARPETWPLFIPQGMSVIVVLRMIKMAENHLGFLFSSSFFLSAMLINLLQQ